MSVDLFLLSALIVDRMAYRQPVDGVSYIRWLKLYNWLDLIVKLSKTTTRAFQEIKTTSTARFALSVLRTLAGKHLATSQSQPRYVTQGNVIIMVYSTRPQLPGFSVLAKNTLLTSQTALMILPDIRNNNRNFRPGAITKYVHTLSHHTQNQSSLMSACCF